MTRRILIVEDSRTQAERLRLLLTREGYEVTVALNGREGLDKVDPGSTDLIVSDVTMPEMDGFEFCRAVKLSEATTRVPVILLTARASLVDIISGLECGADNFIPKPYDDEYLLERVRRIIEELEHRKRGILEMEVHLTVGGRRISVTADRQQIMELLFSTFEEVSRNHDALARANRELEEARAEAERANRAKSEFLSRMSHELRTPLNAVIGFGQLLEMATLAPTHLDSVRRIVEAGRHLLNLINDVLDIGRIDAGELTVSVEPVRTGDILEEAADLVQPLAAERSVTLSGHDTCDVHVMADRQRLKQVLLNLLSNAVKYNRRGGTVTLRCHERVGGRRRIDVIDTGLGIAAEDLHRLFVPFDRIGAERNTAVEGTGLGLVLSRQLVEAMGGTLGVESTVGCGSTFWVELPPAEDLIGRATTERVPSRPRTLPSIAARRAATLLYIEDNPSNLTLVEHILVCRPQIRLITATEGRLGLRLAREHRPDAILLDLHLPDISGDEVLTQLRAAPETRAIPIVVVTAEAAVARLQRSPSMRACTCLTKPFEVRRFLEVVDETLGVRRPPADSVPIIPS
jgi:signal transduction histidine kinase